MDPVAGWYVDPSGVPGQLRWWDGHGWTDHVAPTAPTVDATRPLAAPGAAAGTGSAVPARVPRGLDGPPPPTPPDGRPTGERPPLRTGLIVAAVVVAFVLALVVAGLTGAFGGGAGADDQLTVPSSTAGEIDSGERWTAELVIDTAATVVVDVRGGAGFDPVATLLDDAGSAVGRNDDRLADGVDRFGGDPLDPLVELELVPGTYELEVSGFGDSAGTFDVDIS
jgi:hypothetical protein